MFWKFSGILTGLIFQFSCQKIDLLKKHSLISLDPSSLQPPRGCSLSAEVRSPLAVVITATSTFATSLENPVISDGDRPVTICLWATCSELEIPDQTFHFFFSTKKLQRKSQKSSYNWLEICLARSKGFLWMLQFKIVPSVFSSSFLAILLRTVGIGRSGFSPLRLGYLENKEEA